MKSTKKKEVVVRGNKIMNIYTYTWEDDIMGKSKVPLADMLETMGAQGWELCACFSMGNLTRYFFKKPL